MADLEELLISVNSELGDLSGIDSAIGALSSLKDFSDKASNGAQSLEKMAHAFSSLNKLGSLATGVTRVKGSVNDLVKTLQQLSKYTGDAQNGINQLNALGKAMQSFSGIGQKLQGLDKASEGIKGVVDSLGKLSDGQSKGAIEQLKSLGEALQTYNNLGKNLAGLENIQDGIYGMINVLKALSEYKGKATQSISQFGKLGESLQQFNELGKNLDGLDKVYKGVDKMVNVLERLSKVNVDSNKSIKQLSNLGDALHSFNGLDASLVNLNDVAVALINLSKATDMMKGNNKSDFKYIEHLAGAIKSFDGLMTGRQFANVANITSGLASLTTALADTKKIDVGSIEAIGTAIKSAFNNDDFLHSAGRITNVMHELTNAYNSIGISSGTIRDTMETMVGGFHNAVSALYEVRSNIEAISTDFTDALKPVTNSALFETLEEFKRLNDSYKNVSGLGQGLGQLLESLTALQGKSVNIAPLKQLLTDLEAIANDGKIEQIGSKFEKLGNMAQPVGMLLNSLKYTDLKEGNATLQTLANQLTAFYEALPPKFDKVSYTLNAIRSLVDLAKESKGVDIDPNDNIFVSLSASLQGFSNLVVPNFADFAKAVGELLQFLNKIPEGTKVNTEPIKQLLDTLQYADSSMKNASILLTAVRSIGDVDKIDTSKFKALNEELNNLVMIFAGVPTLDKNAFKGVADTIKSLVEATTKDINAEQLNLVVEALTKMADHLANIKGSNNKINIHLDASGVAQFNKVVERTDEEYSKFARNLNEAIDNVDLSGLFNMDAPLKSLRQQLREAERMLHSTLKQIEQERQKVDRSNMFGTRNELTDRQRVKYEQLRAQAQALRETIQSLNVAIANAPRFETDREGYQYIHNLKEELKGLQDFMKRFNRGGMTDTTTEIGRGFQDVQDRIVAIQDEIRKAEADLQQMDSTEEGLIYRTSEFVNEMSRLADEAERASSEMRNGIGEGFSKFGSMLTGSGNKVLSSFGNLSNMFGKAVQSGTAVLGDTQLASLNQLAGTLGTLATAIGQVSAVATVVISIFKTWWGMMNKIREALGKFVQQAIQFARGMLQHVVGAFNAVAGAVSKVVSAVKSGAEMIVSALRKIGDFGGNVINIFRRVGQAVPVALRGVKAVLTAVTPKFVKTLASSNFSLSKIIKNTHLLKNAIKSVTRYFSMLTRMLMRKSITAFLNQMKQAFEDMVLFEKNAGDAMLNLNTNVSKMFSEMRRSANQWIAVFEPLINAITPTVVGFFANLQAMGENLARFMAILTGQPYYLRAKRFYEDYGDNVEDTKKKVKDLTNGLDELNILSDNKDSEITGITPEDMFEKVPVSGSVKFSIDLKDLIDQIVDWLKNIDWQKIKEKVGDVVDRLMEIVNYILSRLDLWEWLGKTLAELFNTVMVAWNHFITNFDPKATADAITTFIINALNGIDWDLIHENVELTAQKFAQFWNEVFANNELWDSVTTAITNFLNEIVHYFDTWAWTFDFEGLASQITRSLTNIFTGFDYEQLRHAVEGWVTGLADFVNKIASDKQFWRTLGDSIAKIINATIIEAFGDLAKINFTELTDSLKIAIENALTGINWNKYLEDMKKWGENLADIVNGLFGDAGFLTTITTSFANFANGFIGLLDSFLADLKAYDIGLAISSAFEGLENINWDTLFALPAKAINAFSNAIRGLLDGLPEDFNLGAWLTEHLKITMDSINWDELKKNLNDLSKKINEWLNGILQDAEFWTTAGETTGRVIDIGINFLFNLVNFKGEDLGTAIKNYVNGLIGKVNIGDVIRKTVDVAINLIVALDVALKGIDWRTIGDQITQGIIDAIDRIYENRGLIVQTIEDAFAVFNTFINNLINKMIQAGSFRKLGETAGSVVLSLIEGTANFFTMNTGSIVTGMKQLADELARFVSENEDKIVNGLNTIIDGIVAILRTFLDEKSKLYQKFIDIVEQLHLEDLISVILRAVIQGIIETLKMNEAIWKNLTDDLDELVDALWQAVKPIFDYVAGKIKNKIKEWLFGKDGSFFGLTFDPSQLLHTFLTQYVSPLFNLMPHGEDDGGLFSGWGKKISDFWNNLPWNKDKDAEINLTPTIDGGSLEDFTKNHPVELEFKDANLGKIKATTIEVEIFKGKKLNVEEINAEVLNVVEIFADKLHVGEIDDKAKTTKNELAPNYGANDTAVTGTVNNPNGDLHVKNIYAELLDVKKILSELLEVTEIKTELLNAQKIVTDLIDAKKIKTKLLDAKKITTKLLDAVKITTKLLEASQVLTELLDAQKVHTWLFEVDKIDVKDGADGLSVSLQDVGGNLDIEGINAGWLNVPTITADLLRVGTIEGNIKGTSGYTPTGIIGVSTGTSNYDNMFGVPSIERPRIEVGDRWSDLSGLAPHAEDFLAGVEDYWANLADTWGKTVSVTPAVNLAGNNGGYGVTHTLPRNESGSNGSVIPLSSFDKNMSGVVAGAKVKDLPNNADYIRDYLMSFIGNENGVYGLMGNLYAESGLKSNNLQDIKKGEGVTQRDLDYTKNANNSSSSFINDNKGYGLAQWTTSDRKKAFYDSLNGRSVDDLGAQLEYLKSELMSSQYKNVLDKLRNASSIEEASNAVLYDFEKPNDQSASVAELRMAYGQDIAGQLGSYNGTVNIEDEETPKTDGVKGFDEANVIGETGGNGGIFSFLDTLPLQTEYRMAEVYNIIDKWLGRIYKLFKSFTVDGFLEDLLKLNEIGDIFDSTILKELRDVLVEIADLLRKLIEDGIKSVEDTRHLDLNTDAKSQNTRAVEDLTNAIYDWIKCAGDTGHLDNNTIAKSKNTLAVEQLNRIIGGLGTQLANVRCECNCCGNCGGCGGSSTTNRPNVPNYTPDTQHRNTNTISNPSGGTGGGSITPTRPTGTTPTRPTGTTGGGSITPTRPTGTTGGGTGKIVWKQNGKSVPVFINMGGKLVPLTDSSPDYVKQSALSGKYAFVDSKGNALASNQKALLAYIKKKWGNASASNSGARPQKYGLTYSDGTDKDVYALVNGKMELIGDKMSDEVKRNIDKYPLVFADGTSLSSGERQTALNYAKDQWAKKGLLGNTGGISNTGLDSTTHTHDNPVNLDHNTQTADTGTIKNPSGTKTSGGNNTGGGSHNNGGSSGSHDETNNGGSNSGNTSGGSDSSNKGDDGIRRSSWGAPMSKGQYEQDGKIYNANGTVFAISHEKMAELEKEHAEEIEKKREEQRKENEEKASQRREENNKNTLAVGLQNDSDSAKAFQEAQNKLVEEYRQKGKEYLDKINQNGTDADKKTAQNYYNSLITNTGALDATSYKWNLDKLAELASKSTTTKTFGGDYKDLRVGTTGGIFALNELINPNGMFGEKGKEMLAEVVANYEKGKEVSLYRKGNGSWNSANAKDKITDPDEIKAVIDKIKSLGISASMAKAKEETSKTDSSNSTTNVSKPIKQYFDSIGTSGYYDKYLGEAVASFETSVGNFVSSKENPMSSSDVEKLLNSVVYAVRLGSYSNSVKKRTDEQNSVLVEPVKTWYQRFLAKGYQMGGIPNAGEIFVARENGTPEFVGSFGGRTAVANNDQIVTAVANGVAMANDSLRSAIESQTNALENAIDRKNLDVNIGDRQIAEANRRGEKDLGQNFIN